MNSQKRWHVEIDSSVAKALRKFPHKSSVAVEDAIKSLVSGPFAGDIKKIKGEKHVWRRRVGAYRIFYELYPEARYVLVFHVERRGSKTY